MCKHETLTLQEKYKTLKDISLFKLQEKDKALKKAFHSIGKGQGIKGHFTRHSTGKVRGIEVSIFTLQEKYEALKKAFHSTGKGQGIEESIFTLQEKYKALKDISLFTLQEKDKALK